MDSGRFRGVTLPLTAQMIGTLGTTSEMSLPSPHLRRVSGPPAGDVHRVVVHCICCFLPKCLLTILFTGDSANPVLIRSPGRSHAPSLGMKPCFFSIYVRTSSTAFELPDRATGTVGHLGSEGEWEKVLAQYRTRY
jgi:hypothetical protein